MHDIMWEQLQQTQTSCFQTEDWATPSTCAPPEMAAFWSCPQITSPHSNHWCFQTGVLEKTRERPLDYKEIKPVHPKGNQLRIFIGKTDAEVLILWPPDVKSQLIGKDPDARKDWRQEEKGMTEDKMVGWHHWLIGHQLEKIPGDGEGQGSLVYCSPWGCKEPDRTERLKNNNNGNWTGYKCWLSGLGSSQEAQW